MLTHHDDSVLNIKLILNFFENHDDYENTYLMTGKFMKPKDRGLFSKCLLKLIILHLMV